jgi:type II secretory pathway component PulC
MAMEENLGWTESTRELWDEIVYGEGVFRIFRILIGLLIVIGLLWSLFVFKQFVGLGQSASQTLSEAVQAKSPEVEKLDALVQSYRNQALIRSGSGRLAELALAAGRSPFAEPPSLAAVEAVPGRGGPVIPVEVPPPNVNVKAVMMLGSASVAVVDIDGVGQNLVVKPGFTFAGKHGKIVSINPDKLVFLWNGKKQETLATSLLGGF